jgi:hypothetical protein
MEFLELAASRATPGRPRGATVPPDGSVVPGRRETSAGPSILG